MVKLVQNKKLLHGDCKSKYLHCKDLNVLPKIAACAELVSVLRKSGAETLKISLNPSLRKRDLPPGAIPPFVKED
ncbi:MAG: hypothetical protein WBD99_16270 [Thermodesulfobacteriota bacterium]